MHGPYGILLARSKDGPGDTVLPSTDVPTEHLTIRRGTELCNYLIVTPYLQVYLTSHVDIAQADLESADSPLHVST